MRKVFIDCGCNVGRVLERAVRRRPEFEFFAFEANADLIPIISQRIQKYPDRKIEVFNKAVWTHNDGLNFFVGPTEASSVMQGVRVPFLLGKQLDYHNPRHTESIDFSQWILNNFDLSDYLIVKMDIEGAEYQVLEKMIEDRSIFYIDRLYVEWHWHLIDDISREQHNRLIEQLKWLIQLKKHHTWDMLNYFAV